MSLRPLTMDDAEQILEWRNSPRVAAFMYTNEPISLTDHMQWLQGALESSAARYWMIEHRGNDVGVANLADIDRRNQRCSWAFYLGAPDVPGPVAVGVEFEIMGIVFGEMGFHKLISEVLGFNERVIDMHERAGFVREGRLRDHIQRNDGTHDVVVLSMLRPEWEERHEPRWRKRR